MIRRGEDGEEEDLALLARDEVALTHRPSPELAGAGYPSPCSFSFHLVFALSILSTYSEYSRLSAIYVYLLHPRESLTALHTHGFWRRREWPGTKNSRCNLSRSLYHTMSSLNESTLEQSHA